MKRNVTTPIPLSQYGARPVRPASTARPHTGAAQVKRNVYAPLPHHDVRTSRYFISGRNSLSGWGESAPCPREW